MVALDEQAIYTEAIMVFWLSRRSVWIVCALGVGLMVGGLAGWWIGQQPVADLRQRIDTQRQAYTVLEQQSASQSARVAGLEQQLAGYQDYVVSHTQQSVDARYLTGYQSPIAGMQPPYTNVAAMPGAGRAYRGGIHEGMDYIVRHGTPALAVGTGRIIRADENYIEPPMAQLTALSVLSEQLQFTPENTLDTFRGRQVWLLLPGNVIVRYCHLESVAVKMGQIVDAGTVVGATGSSGTLDHAQHLHFEIRVGNTYLGAGQAYPALVTLVRQFFSRQ